MLPPKFPNDSGPLYLETISGRFPVEPFNTYSNLVFIALLIYWGVQVYKNSKRQRFLTLVLPIIFISYLGGTLYHATRSHEIWLLLDWVPIMVLCGALAVYFICKLVPNWWKRLCFVVLLFGASFVLRQLPIGDHLKISLGYIVTALTILIPQLWYMYKTKWANTRPVALAFFFFGLAICFRSIDLQQDFFTMGTHWLWHLFGGFAVHFLIAYVFKDNSLNLPPRKANDHDRNPKATSR